MLTGPGPATDGVNDGDGVQEGIARHDVAWLDVELEELFHVAGCTEALFLLLYARVSAVIWNDGRDNVPAYVAGILAE